MIYAYIMGRVAVTVRDWVERGDEVEAGARLEVRRVDKVTLPRRHRPGAEGWRVASVGEGGIWRSDILSVVGGERQPRYHHHPDFSDGDVGPRVFDDDMALDPVTWTMDRISDLPALLIASGAGDLAAEVNPDEVAEALPLIEESIRACLSRVERSVASGAIT